MARAGKRQLTFWLSEESIANLRAFSDAQGVTVTALVEVLGRGLRPTARPPRWLNALVREARVVDGERRQRSKGEE